MLECYEETVLTPLRVAQSSGYIDWATQPNLFKHYPDFLFRYPFSSEPTLEMLALCRMITSQHMIVNRPYYRLSTPSAGNLHPLEVYVQIRGIKGILSGIYHLDAGASSLVLIREIEHDGLESEVGLQAKYKGMLFILTVVPFRSEWKYGKRAIRYCYMDLGHQIGAIEMALATRQQEVTFLSDFDAQRLHQKMGLSDEEFVTAVIVSGSENKQPVEPLKYPLMKVSPLTYSEGSGYVETLLDVATPYKASSIAITKIATKEEIKSRRSARKFISNGMKKHQFEYFMQLLATPIKASSCYLLVMHERLLPSGVYRNNKLLFQGSVADTISALLVNQKFVLQSDIVFIITAQQASKDTLVTASRFGHYISMHAEHLGVGYSCIGAFYDNKLRTFLKSDDAILYVGVLGAKEEV